MLANQRSEQHELLSHVSDDFVRGHLEDVEVDCFCEGSALSYNCDVSDFDVEGG